MQKNDQKKLPLLLKKIEQKHEQSNAPSDKARTILLIIAINGQTCVRYKSDDICSVFFI